MLEEDLAEEEEEEKTARKKKKKEMKIQYNIIQYNTTLLSLCREICFLARHLHKNIQYS